MNIRPWCRMLRTEDHFAFFFQNFWIFCKLSSSYMIVFFTCHNIAFFPSTRDSQELNKGWGGGNWMFWLCQQTYMHIWHYLPPQKLALEKVSNRIHEIWEKMEDAAIKSVEYNPSPDGSGRGSKLMSNGGSKFLCKQKCQINNYLKKRV